MSDLCRRSDASESNFVSGLHVGRVEGCENGVGGAIEYEPGIYLRMFHPFVT